MFWVLHGQIIIVVVYSVRLGWKRCMGLLTIIIKLSCCNNMFFVFLSPGLEPDEMII